MKKANVNCKKFDKFAWLKDVGRTDLDKEAKCCAFVLFNYSDENGENCYPSYSTLENEASLSDKGVKKGLEDLLFAGLLRIEKHTTGRNVYFLLMVPGWEGRISSRYKFQRTKKAPRGGRQSTVRGERSVNAPGRWNYRANEAQASCGADLNYLPPHGLSYQDHIITKSNNTPVENISAASQKDSGFRESRSIGPSIELSLRDIPLQKERELSSTPDRRVSEPIARTSDAPSFESDWGENEECYEFYWDKNGNEVMTDKNGKQVVVRDSKGKLLALTG